MSVNTSFIMKKYKSIHGLLLFFLAIFFTKTLALSQTYTNPVQLYNADPHVLKHSDTYYLYGTDTKHYNGFKVYSSDDLVNWVEHDEKVLVPGPETGGSKSFWAPEVVEKNGKFYMFYTADEAFMYVAVSDSPLGPFTKHSNGRIFENWALDGNYFKDDDGQEYYYFGYNGISVAKISPDFKTLSDIKQCFNHVTHPEDWVTEPVNEAPTMLKHKGLYYLVYSGNGTGPNYGVGYATSTSPTGPWTKFSGNPIMQTTDPVRGPGHQTFAYSPDGSELFIIYHSFDEFRRTNIDRAEWVSQPNGPDVLKIKGPTSTPQPMPSAKGISGEK